MRHRTLPVRFVLLALGLSACAAANRTRSDLPAGPTPEVPSSAPVLYARDGSVVNAGAPAGATTQNGPAGDRAPQEGSRTYLLELYQKAIDEKEALALEVKNIAATLEKSRGELAAALKAKEELDKKFVALDAERARLQEENFDLAGRLVTAQIRRLEAEKLLLESKIEWQRLEDKTGDKAKASPASVREPARSEKSDKNTRGEGSDKSAKGELAEGSAEHKP